MLRAFEIIPDLLLRVFVPLLFVVGVGWVTLLLWRMVRGPWANVLGCFRGLPPVAKGLMGCFTNGVSLLPEARWGLLPHTEALSHGGGSVFRHAVTTNGSLLLDWHNALVGRDMNCPTNLQIELYCDGRFAWRTDDESRFYLPVFPFDWDGDGLENSVDPEPLAAGLDAHGTNAEWYNTVCSNVFITTQTTQTTQTILPPGISFRTNVNDRAYYFAAVVAAQGPAPIYFNADRDSRLGSPVVVALAGETNHVPLLIGVEYMVTSTVPISVSVPDAMYATVTSNSTQSATIRWPLFFEFSDMTQGTYVVNVLPYDPGGEFSWDHSMAYETGATLQSILLPTSCGCWYGVDSSVSFNCSTSCTCYGGCQASGLFICESAVFSVTGGVCRCGHYDPPQDDEVVPPLPDPEIGGISICFSPNSVIFEDSYTNTPNDVVQKQSTTTRLTISASGGQRGGSFVLTTQNLDKLCPENGTGPFAITQGMSLSPGQTYFATFVCSGQKKSGTVNDVRIDAEFTDVETGYVWNSCAMATVVKIEVVPECQFPADLPNRHTFGVCESVGFYVQPNGLEGVVCESSGNTLEVSSTGNKYVFEYLLDVGGTSLTFSYDSVEYLVQTTCVAPSQIVCDRQPAIKTFGALVGQAGGVGMELPLTLCPSNVSFCGIRVKEEIMNDGVPSGYFNQSSFSNWWNHTNVQGANNPVTVGSFNDFGDQAEMNGICPPISGSAGWSWGSITWTIPTVWREPRTFSLSKGYQDLSSMQQRFTIDPIGTVGVEKFGYRVERDTGGETSLSVLK